MAILSRFLLMAACVLAWLPAAPALAGGDHGGVSPGPLTALSRLSSAPALSQARVSPERVSVPLAQWVTPEGLRVAWWHSSQLPMLDVRLIFDAGAARDGQRSGLAAAVSGLIDEGTRQRSAQAVAEGFERLGAEFGASSYRDMALLQMRVLSAPAQRDPALDLFAEVAAEPAFPAEAWDRQRESMRIGQRQRQQSPAGRAGLLFYQRLYGDHPYANPPSGLAASVERIRPRDMQAFHGRYYNVRNAVLVLVGDIPRAQAELVAARIASRLPAGEPAGPLPAVRPLSETVHLHEDFPSQQVHVVLGETGIARGDPDYFPLLVGNELLGGSGFGTLLMRELRERRGLTYSVSSQFVHMREAGPFQIAFSTRADQAGMALALTRDLLRRFVEQGAPAADVQAAIDNLVQSFPRSVSNNAQIASFLGMMAFYGLPADFIDSYTDRLRAVTPLQVREAVARRLHPDRLLIVTVGRPLDPPPVLAPATEPAVAPTTGQATAAGETP